MHNPIFTLTGGQTQTGTGIDNTQTDVAQIYGLGNTWNEPNANLLLVGGNGSPFSYPWDSNTGVVLGGSGVNDSITLDGGTNSVTGTLTASTVAVTVTSLGTNPLGANTVAFTNAGGTNTVGLSGSNNAVNITGAMNTVSILGSSSDDERAALGSLNDSLSQHPRRSTWPADKSQPGPTAAPSRDPNYAPKSVTFSECS